APWLARVRGDGARVVVPAVLRLVACGVTRAALGLAVVIDHRVFAPGILRGRHVAGGGHVARGRHVAGGGVSTDGRRSRVGGFATGAGGGVAGGGVARRGRAWIRLRVVAFTRLACRVGGLIGQHVARIEHDRGDRRERDAAARHQDLEVFVRGHGETVPRPRIAGATN